MEEAANRIVRYLYDNLMDKETGDKALALVRLFKTHSYDQLDEELRGFARSMLNESPTSPEMKCLTLLASAGTNADWNSRKNSSGHKALPLPSDLFINKFPMVRQLVQQLGLEVNTVLQPDPDVVVDLSQKTYNVFYVPDAVGSKYVPAQEEFVVPYGVKTVLGFGGILPSGDLFAVIMFCKDSLSRKTADMFKTVALSVKVALLPFDRKAVFSGN